jgi:catechol 2,3-dioxygenase-like lactoylglutathione lyase family enzyme
MTSSRDVIIRAESLEAAKAFYHGVMGFAITTDEERLAGFDTGSITLYVEPGTDPTPVFDFEADDFEAAKARLLRKGCSIIEEDPAVPRCYFRDPFGLVFNLAEA